MTWPWGAEGSKIGSLYLTGTWQAISSGKPNFLFYITICKFCMQNITLNLQKRIDASFHRWFFWRHIKLKGGIQREAEISPTPEQIWPAGTPSEQQASPPTTKPVHFAENAKMHPNFRIVKEGNNPRLRVSKILLQDCVLLTWGSFAKNSQMAQSQHGAHQRLENHLF